MTVQSVKSAAVCSSPQLKGAMSVCVVKLIILALEPTSLLSWSTLSTNTVLFPRQFFSPSYSRQTNILASIQSQILPSGVDGDNIELTHSLSSKRPDFKSMLMLLHVSWRSKQAPYQLYKGENIWNISMSNQLLTQWTLW